MTEEQWLESSDPLALLAALPWGEYDRPLRLAACALWRRHAHFLKTIEERQAVQVAERYADGKASLESLAAFRALRLGVAAGRGNTALRETQSRVRQCLPWSTVIAPDGELIPPESHQQVMRLTADLIREVIGNPFQAPAMRPEWLAANDSAVVRLAEAIYQEQAFERMPILGDALEDGGCSDERILTHCRQHGEHVRGCWVLDLVLGKR
jgi:hypothetical protein